MVKGVAINGAGGRIGRAVTNEFSELDCNKLEVRLLNEQLGIDYVVNSYRNRDPVHGVYPWKIEKLSDNQITINGLPVYFTAEKDLSNIPFKDKGIDMILECSGFFGDPKPKDKTTKLTSADNLANKFIQYGIETVIQTYPVKTADAMLVMGVNHQLYDQRNHRTISNASCTTKALAMPLQVLIDNGIHIDALSMDTTHAATASQGKDPGVLGTLSQILTHSTGAAKATGLVIPSLAGRMTGMSYRVPTLDGSFANLYFVALSNVNLNQEKLNEMFASAVKDPRYAGRIGIHEGKDAGTFDIIGRRENAVIIPSKTIVIPLSFMNNNLSKPPYAHLITVISGYDNELGSSVDPVLLAKYIAEKH